MANMSYCRFRNTLNDLRDCENNFHEDDLSDDEYRARHKMIHTMINMLEAIGVEINADYIDEMYTEER